MLPVVLHHGLLSVGRVQVGSRVFGAFSGIDRAIAQRGHAVLMTQVHPTAGIATRARQLKSTILEHLEAAGRSRQRVIIIAHSMGGLDARYMISKLGMAQRVAALVTVATPHRGSPYADWCLSRLDRMGAFRFLHRLGLDTGAAADLTCPCCARFNEETPDASGVRYYSVSTARPWQQISPLLLHSWRIIHEQEGDNDGLVSVRSAIWGEHLGTWPADHAHAINKRLLVEWVDKTGDITPYYLRILDRLDDDLRE